jgi:uncharacterized protein HemY
MLASPLGVVVLGVVVLFRTTSCLGFVVFGVVVLGVVVLGVVVLGVVLGTSSATTNLRGNYRSSRRSRCNTSRCGRSR